jgi:hypothetical protein
MHKKTYILLFVWLIVAACNNAKEKKTVHHDASEPKYTVKLHLQKGAKYYCNLFSETASDMELVDKKVSTGNQSEIGLIYEVMEDSSVHSGFKLKITYDKLHLITRKDDKETELNTENGANSFNKTEQAMGALKGSAVYVFIDSVGKISKVEGYDVIANKVMSVFGNLDVESRKNIRAQITQMTGDGFVKNNVEQMFKLFPDTAVYIGDSWSDRKVDSSVMPFNVSNVYTFKSIDHGIGKVEFTAEFSPTDKALNGREVKVIKELSGTQDGEFWVDMTSGLVQKSNMQAKIKAMIEVQGREIPVKIRIKRGVNINKIN